MTVASIRSVSWESMNDLSVNLWICDLNQYDEQKGLEFSYGYVYDWYNGITQKMDNRSILNWGGSQNLSSEAAKLQLFPTNYENIDFGILPGRANEAFLNISYEEFLFNTGRCRVIEDLQHFDAAGYSLTENLASHQFFVVERNQSTQCGITELSFHGDSIKSLVEVGRKLGAPNLGNIFFGSR